MSQHNRIVILSRLLASMNFKSMTPLLTIFIISCSGGDGPFDVGPCLSPACNNCDWEMGPCLSPPPPDMHTRYNSTTQDMSPDMQVTPCLGMPFPDMSAQDMAEDMYVGPCLSPPAPDMREEDMPDMPDMSDMPAGDMSTKPDMDIGPCLSPPAPDMSAIDADVLRPSLPPGGDAGERERLLAKLADRLPADVLARLGASKKS